jgi:hypothetical protein
MGRYLESALQVADLLLHRLRLLFQALRQLLEVFDAVGELCEGEREGGRERRRV